MAYKEVSRVEVTEIMRRWQTGATIRGLARASGLSRNTINKYILAAESCGLTRTGPAKGTRTFSSVFTISHRVEHIPGYQRQ